MSAPLRSPSRRTLLRALGFAPLALLGVTLDRDEEADVDAVLAQAPLGAREREKLTRIATTLFRYLKKGAGPVEILTPEVIAKAYEMSGPYVVRNLAEWNDDGDQAETNACAALCGHRARLLAEAAGASEVSVDQFVQAWEETRDDQARRMSRLRGALARRSDGAGSVRLAFGCA